MRPPRWAWAPKSARSSPGRRPARAAGPVPRERGGPAEALAAVTINAASALGLGAEIGSIEPGKQADLVIWAVPTVEQLPYWLGASLVRTVVKRGRLVFERG